MVLLHGIDLLADQLHLVDLCLDWLYCQNLSFLAVSDNRLGSRAMLTLVLVVFTLALQVVDLCANTVDQLIQARTGGSSRRSASHTTMRVHGHIRDTGNKAFLASGKCCSVVLTPSELVT